MVRRKRRGWLLMLIPLAVWFAVEGVRTGNRDQPVPQNVQNDHPPSIGKVAADVGRMVRVSVWDDTESKPLPDKAELWFRGYGSWWLKPATKFGGDTKKLGDRQPGNRDSLMLYPDGRDGGREITIPIETTTEMSRLGSARDTITISISDDEVEVVGLAIEAATGETSFTVER